MQVSFDTQENRPNALNRGDFFDVLQAFRRFDHGDGQKIALGIQRPEVGMP